MITNCLPFAVWISVIISTIIFIAFTFKKSWFQDGLGENGVLVIGLLVMIATTFVCATRVVALERFTIPVVIKNTKQETIAFDKDKNMICSFSRQPNSTNGFHRIIQQNYIGMFGDTVKIDYVYAP